MTHAWRLHRARRHDREAEIRDDQRFQVTHRVHFMGGIERDAARRHIVGSEFGRVGPGVKQEARFLYELYIQIDAILLGQCIIRTDNEVEGLGEHRPRIQPIPIFSQRTADREFDVAVPQHLADF